MLFINWWKRRVGMIIVRSAVDSTARFDGRVFIVEALLDGVKGVLMCIIFLLKFNRECEWLNTTKTLDSYWRFDGGECVITRRTNDGLKENVDGLSLHCHPWPSLLASFGGHGDVILTWGEIVSTCVFWLPRLWSVAVRYCEKIVIQASKTIELEFLIDLSPSEQSYPRPDHL